MYYAHFGLIRPPFRITPDPSLFFSGADRGSMLEALSYVVMSGEGITKVIGEVGSGKTMLCRMLEEKLPENVATIYIANPNISPDNILHAIAFEAGIDQPPDNKMELMQLFQNWLLENYANNRRVVVLIEEAQGMPIETLEEIRLLSNVETGQEKLMQIVLFGQPELDEKLARPDIRQLQDRIAHNFNLNPLTKEQIQDYLNFRVRQAGYHGPDLFTDKVSRTITRASKGLIRRVNILADKTLLAAFSAGTTRLSPGHVKIAVNDSKFTDSRSPIPQWQILSAAATAGALLAILIAWIFWPDSASEATVTRTNRQQQMVTASSERTSETRSIANTRLNEGKISADRAEAVIRQQSADSIIASEAEQLARSDIDELARQAVSTSLLQHRIMVTRRWLEQAREQQYCIQLMMIKATSAGNLNRYLERLPNTIDLDDIFVYETELGEGPMLGVLYQQFDSRKAALDRMKNMPAAFENIEPYLLRSVRGLRNEISHKNS